MKVIWKYEVEINEEFYISMPAQAKIFYVAVQDGTPFLWALVDPEKEHSIRKLGVFGTGHPIHGFYVDYIGSFMLHGGNFVGHLFEYRKE